MNFQLPFCFLVYKVIAVGNLKRCSKAKQLNKNIGFPHLIIYCYPLPQKSIFYADLTSAWSWILYFFCFSDIKAKTSCLLLSLMCPMKIWHEKLKRKRNATLLYFDAWFICSLGNWNLLLITFKSNCSFLFSYNQLLIYWKRTGVCRKMIKLLWN